MLEKMMIDNHALHAYEIGYVLKRLEEAFAQTEEQIAQMKKENETIKQRNEDHERRLLVLEEPKNRKFDMLRIYEERMLPMNGDHVADKKNGEAFRFVIPREALTLATEEALERGLLTKI